MKENFYFIFACESVTIFFILKFVEIKAGNAQEEGGKNVASHFFGATN